MKPALPIGEEIERIARREATARGFDVAKEPFGLFRAIANVLCKSELLREAARAAEDRAAAKAIAAEAGK